MTFSIVARDERTGAFGVATATGGPVVGVLVPHARAGVGAIATQSYTNPFYGFEGLDLLAAGHAPDKVLDMITAADEGREKRQCIVVGADGVAAGWTGELAEPSRGHAIRDGVAVAGNMLANDDVISGVLSAYEAAMSLTLEERLLAALRGGQAMGGDKRGTRSAALKVFTDQPFPAVDIRADWSATPIADLETVFEATRTGPYADFFKDLPRSRKRPPE